LRIGVQTRLGNVRSRVRNSAGERDFLFSKTIQVDSGVYTASYSMGTFVFPDGGRGGGGKVARVLHS